MIHLCRHILPGGKLCDQASVRDTLYCRHHGAVKAALEREQAVPGPELGHTPLALVYPEDKAAIQLNLFLVLEALNQKRIDVRTANAMNRLLRACEQNLRTGTLVEPNREKVAQNVIVLPDGEEVAMPREAMEAHDDPDEDHSLGCPCQECAGKTDYMPKEQHHAACQCGACEPAVGASGEAVRETPVGELYHVPPEPFDSKHAPAWIAAEPHGSAYQDKMFEQQQERKKRERSVQRQQAQQPSRKQQERDHAMKEALGAEYELRTDTEVTWKKGMKEALLQDYKQALAENRPYQPRDLAASGA